MVGHGGVGYLVMFIKQFLDERYITSWPLVGNEGMNPQYTNIHKYVCKKISYSMPYCTKKLPYGAFCWVIHLFFSSTFFQLRIAPDWWGGVFLTNIASWNHQKKKSRLKNVKKKPKSCRTKFNNQSSNLCLVVSLVLGGSSQDL